MKKEFSTKWIGSKRPGKQRKYRANAPIHIQSKFLSVNLSKDLRKKHGVRNTRVRKNDKVKVLRGKFKGIEGKVTAIKKLRVAIEGVQVKKKDGSKVNVFLQPSNLQIVELYLDDKKRSQKLGAKATPNPEKKETKKTEKENKKEEKKQDVKKPALKKDKEEKK